MDKRPLACFDSLCKEEKTPMIDSFWFLSLYCSLLSLLVGGLSVLLRKVCDQGCCDTDRRVSTKDDTY